MLVPQLYKAESKEGVKAYLARHRRCATLASPRGKTSQILDRGGTKAVQNLKRISPRSRPYAPTLDHSPNLRDEHAAVWLPAHRDLVEPRSRVHARAKSVAAPLVSANPCRVQPGSADAVSVSTGKLIPEISHKPETHINQPNRRFLESRKMRRVSVS